VWGSAAGVVLGCVLGLVNLLLIDTGRSQELKEQASLEEEPYRIEMSNSKRDNATVISIHGPDRQGLMASIANTFSDLGLSLLEVSARPSSSDVGNATAIEDVFVVQRQDAGGDRRQIADDQLEEVARALQEATTIRKRITVETTS